MLAVAVAYLLKYPRDDEVGEVDAVVVLAGGKVERLPKGLVYAGLERVPVVAISEGSEAGWPQANRLCGRKRPFRVICFNAEPFSTEGEAQWTARAARARGWDAVLVVTSNYHVRRTRILFRRCVDARVAVAGAQAPLGAFVVGAALELPKLAWALIVDREC